ncbi:MAG TPA: type II toxin-antitoxin system prevent-host-death family antitoxin [Propylenella sp.]
MQIFRSQDLQRQAAALQEAAMKEPVLITYHDRPRLVLMSMEEYDRLHGRNRRNSSIVRLPDKVADHIEAFAEVEGEPAE